GPTCGSISTPPACCSSGWPSCSPSGPGWTTTSASCATSAWIDGLLRTCRFEQPRSATCDVGDGRTRLSMEHSCTVPFGSFVTLLVGMRVDGTLDYGTVV